MTSMGLNVLGLFVVWDTTIRQVERMSLAVKSTLKVLD